MSILFHLRIEGSGHPLPYSVQIMLLGANRSQLKILSVEEFKERFHAEVKEKGPEGFPYTVRYMGSDVYRDGD